jgi:hypothetical protein
MNFQAGPIENIKREMSVFRGSSCLKGRKQDIIKRLKIMKGN